MRIRFLPLKYSPGPKVYCASDLALILKSGYWEVELTSEETSVIIETLSDLELLGKLEKIKDIIKEG